MTRHFVFTCGSPDIWSADQRAVASQQDTAKESIRRNYIMRQSATIQGQKQRSVLFLAAIAICSASLSFAAEGQGSCSANSEVRQLDYWLGNWTMKSAGGSSTNGKVTLSLD